MFDSEKLSKYMWVAVAVMIIAIGTGLLIAKGRVPDNAVTAMKEDKSFQPPPAALSASPVTPVPKVESPPAIAPTQTAQAPLSSTAPSTPVIEPKAPALPVSEKLEVGNVPGKLKVSVAQMKAGDRLPLDHTCYRKNASPPMSWTDAPAGTKGYVVLFEKTPSTDKEKARPNKMIHWAVYNIPSTLTAIPRSIPKAPLLQNGIGQANAAAPSVYIGPCQPKGKHEFKFRVFALDTALKLPGGASVPELYGAMNGHILDEGVFPVEYFYK